MRWQLTELFEVKRSESIARGFLAQHFRRNQDSWKIRSTCKKPMAKIKVLQFSPHNEDCGVGKYQEQFVSIIRRTTRFQTKFFDSSPVDQLEVMRPSSASR